MYNKYAHSEILGHMVEEILAGSFHENMVRHVKEAEDNVRMPILDICKNFKNGTLFLDTF